MRATFVRDVRLLRALYGAVFGLFAAGCEMDLKNDPAGAKTSSADPVVTVPSSTDATSSADPVSSADQVRTAQSSADTSSAVLNDDPNCDLVLKYQNHNITNLGQVHYLNRVLTSDPFGSANPICVQYNDTQTGEVTVWKDPSSTGQRVDYLPHDRVIDKIVVWYR